MKNLVLLSALSLLTASPVFAAKDAGKDVTGSGAPTRIALINMQLAIKDTKDGKKAEESLRKDFEATQKSLKAEADKIEKSMDELRKQGMVMDEKTRSEKQIAIQKQGAEFEELKMRKQQEFQKRDQEVSQPIIGKMRTIVAQISKEKGYTLVMDASTVVYGNAEDDITEEVVKRYDAKK